MSQESVNTDAELLLYPVCGTIGSVGVPGAPIVKFSLLVGPFHHTVTGMVIITQGGVVMKPIVVHVKGTIRPTRNKPYTQVVNIQGKYVHSFTPPAIGSVLASFSATMYIDNAWNGKGSFSYFRHSVEDVPVKRVPCIMEPAPLSE